MRIKNLANGMPDLVGESLEDTILDLLVYSGIDLCMLREVLNDSRNESVEQADTQER